MTPTPVWTVESTLAEIPLKGQTPSPTEVDRKLQDAIFLTELERKQQIWESKQIDHYRVTVSIFSTILAPSCESVANLTVRNGKLDAIAETVTPMAIPINDDQIIFNPQCHLYENYTVEAMMAEVSDILEGKVAWRMVMDMKFDPEYGFIRYLNIFGSDSVMTVEYSDFVPLD